MRVLPAGARLYVLCAVLGALWCTAPAITADAPDPPWPTLAALAALGLALQAARCPRAADGRPPEGTGAFFPVLLAAVQLLPPAAAALAAVPGALAAPPAGRPAGVRRIWHAAEQALATWAAAQVFGLAHGPEALRGPGPGAVPDLPYLLLPTAAAAVTLCLVLTALEGGILAAAEGLPARAAWHGGPGRVLVPHLVHAAAGLMTAVLWTGPYGPAAAALVLLPVCISCWVFAQYHRERAAHQATIRALVQAVDIKDRYTRGHGERVGQAATMIGRELGLPRDRLETVRIAGILHDLGKIGVPTRLLRKDGPLTPEERRIIELHPEYGHEMVRGIAFLGEARAAILHHHERVDGSGYPYGLAGDRIPESARLIAVADAFDAMTSTRSYSRARPVPVALAELERCAGAQFDPAMVAALRQALERHGWHPVVTADCDVQPAGGLGQRGLVGDVHGPVSGGARHAVRRPREA
ncbi:HD domain-containing phosphohydrolase, partial [Streptomyces sp. NPDC097619]|uniref:HD-GYP domain-containing protein n=1 Tax=Streptomyces sp. NPDC097619 TaxID=3157228 RepID=UPI00332BCD8D